MTSPQAKRLLKDFLDNNGYEYDKLTAKTVSFQDLARDGCVFVKVHGLNWQTNPNFDLVSHFAKTKGFRAQVA